MQFEGKIGGATIITCCCKPEDTKKETAVYGNLSFALPLGLEPRTP